MSEEGEEIIGTVESSKHYSRSDGTLWLQPKSSINRHFCTRCKRGEHSLGFDYPCSDTCQCLCKTHYIARDGFSKIPYGMKDTTKDKEPEPLPDDPIWIKLMEQIRDGKIKI